ncbi:DUF4301 family protein [Chondrinema litorale]|uniref:DUF4301 family protein n=1 Tax=Chondrinema litorale TaxID=2994555 RepID=UPI002542844C|nr:DUF4301 family protein [Chondrinema litorale]UZR93494.1 DUF4301 family protein [Chondrinema litorale]
MKFSDTDLSQLQSLGIKTETAGEQIENFKKGFPFLKLIKPATIGDGILKLDDSQIADFEKLFDTSSKSKKVVKFVPASGAASRMFKALFGFMESYEGTEEAYEAFTAKKGAVFSFFKELEKFAFYEELKQTLENKGMLLEKMQLEREYPEILANYLTEKGMNYGSLPKGLLQFHNYEDGSRTPVEEHMVEGANYCKDDNGLVRIHLTVSPEHESKFKEKIESVRSKYEEAFNVKFDISFSQQKKSTDTIAVDMENEPFRNEDGSILFRPGGHGALLENLNDIDADIIFIKNIDNVVPDKIKQTTFTYKKVIGGVLIQFQDKVFSILKNLSSGNPSDEDLASYNSFLENDLCTKSESAFGDKSREDKITYLINKFNRPLRVCGMVKNEGEPGGGPFWAVNNDSTVSLQVAESAQIDMNDAEQKEIASSATHFNPVDLVCAVKDFNGNKFDLMKFRDPKTGFISYKSKDGKELKAQELPGLWNGSMSDWNTLFVEVPIITFNPVKTVNDLLRDQHQ